MSLLDTVTNVLIGKRSLVTIVVILVLFFPIGVSIAEYLMPAPTGSSQPFLERPAAKHKSCLDDAPYMRYHHMDLIKEIRNAGVRGGAIRETSFSSCRECHVSREKFCMNCHEAVNLKPDCFECHYYP